MKIRAPRPERRLLLVARRDRRVLLVPETGDSSWTLPTAILRSRGTASAARALAARHCLMGIDPERAGSFQHRTYSHDLTFEVWTAETGSDGAEGLWATPAQLRSLPLRAPTLKALKAIRR